MLNPYNLGQYAWMAFGALAVISVGVGIGAAFASFWASRERRDGKR